MLLIACHTSVAAPAAKAVAPPAKLPATSPTPSSAGVSLGPAPAISKAADTAWCWAKPKPLGDTNYPLHHQVVQLERAMIAETIAGTKSSGVLTELGSIGEQLAKDSTDHAYVIGPVSFEAQNLPANLHVTTEPYAASARAFDSTSSARVYFIHLHVDGYVEDGKGFSGVRATVEIRGAFGEPKLSRNYGRTTSYCVTSSADGKLSVAVKEGARG
jgi:hypothetical protein